MAEERNVGLARAPESASPTASTAETEATKEELQRRMEEARESITQTVAEIKETVTQQYNQVRETISETLDWREQFRRRPVPFVAGAVGLGLLLGYGIGGAFAGGEGDDELDGYAGGRRDELDDEDEDVRASISASNLGAAISPARSYAATPITGGPSPSSSDEPSRAQAPTPSARGFASQPGASSAPSAAPLSLSRQDVGPETRPAFAAAAPGGSFAGGADDLDSADGATASEDEADKPGLLQRIQESGVIDKFKESRAYDKLQQELGTLGDRFIEELSTTARNVVVPALLSKLKDMIGIDLGTQREGAQRSRAEHETGPARARPESAAQSSGAGA